MKRKTANLEFPEQGLLDLDEPGVVLVQVQTAQLATLVGALLIEIAAALAAGEEGDEQDHR